MQGKHHNHCNIALVSSLNYFVLIFSDQFKWKKKPISWKLWLQSWMVIIGQIWVGFLPLRIWLDLVLKPVLEGLRSGSSHPTSPKEQYSKGKIFVQWQTQGEGEESSCRRNRILSSIYAKPQIRFWSYFISQIFGKTRRIILFIWRWRKGIGSPQWCTGAISGSLLSR